MYILLFRVLMNFPGLFFLGINPYSKKKPNNPKKDTHD